MVNKNFTHSILSDYSLLFILILPLLVSGPLLPEIIILLFLFLFFYREGLKNNIKIFYNDKANLFLFIFYIYLVINSIFFSQYPLVSVKSSLPYVRHILFSFFFSLVLIKDIKKNYIKLFIYSFLTLILLLTLDSFYQLYLGKNILGFELFNSRVSSFFGKEQIMGSFTSRFLPIVIAILYISEIKNAKYFQYFLIIASTILVVLSLERTASVYLLVTAILFLFIEAKNLKKFLISLLLFLIFFFTLFKFYYPAKARILTSSINQIKSSTLPIIPSYRHELHYFNSYLIFKDNFLFGAGVKSFRFACSDYNKIVEKKIIKDKAIFAPYSGFLKLKINNIYSIITFISEDNKNNKIFEIPIGNFLDLNKKINEKIKINKGEYMFSTYEFATGCNTHPHNTILLFLSETGLVGFLFLLLFVFLLLRQFFKVFCSLIIKSYVSNNDKALILVTSSILINFFPLLPNGNLFNNWMSMVFFIQFGFLQYLTKSK